MLVVQKLSPRTAWKLQKGVPWAAFECALRSCTVTAACHPLGASRQTLALPKLCAAHALLSASVWHWASLVLLSMGMALIISPKLSVLHHAAARLLSSGCTCRLSALAGPEPALAMLCSCPAPCLLLPTPCCCRPGACTPPSEVCCEPAGRPPPPADIRSSAQRKRYLPWHQRILRVTRTHFRGMLLTYLADFLVTTGIDTVRWGTAHACSHADSERQGLVTCCCLVLGLDPWSSRPHSAI